MGSYKGILPKRGKNHTYDFVHNPFLHPAYTQGFRQISVYIAKRGELLQIDKLPAGLLFFYEGVSLLVKSTFDIPTFEYAYNGASPFPFYKVIRIQ